MSPTWTVYSSVADTWLANFESQLQVCVQQPGQREGLGVGEVLPLDEQQELQRGAIRDKLRQGAGCGLQDLHQGSVRAPQLLHDGVARVVQ